MAIVKMSKFNLIAFDSQRAKILKRLQKFKEVNFVDFNVENKDETLKKIINNEELTRIEERIYSVNYSISLLKKYQVIKKNIKAVMKGNDNYTFEELAKKAAMYDWKELSHKLKELGSALDETRSKISKKYVELDSISLWDRLDINPEELKKLKTVNTYLGTIPYKLKSNFIGKMNELEKTYYEELKVTKEDIYYMIISGKEDEEKEKLLEIFRETSFTVEDLKVDTTPEEHIRKLKNEIQELKKEKNKIKSEIKSYDGELSNLEAVYEYLKNKKLRITETEKMAKTENMCIISGWIPTSKREEFEKEVADASRSNYYIDFEEADLNDGSVPIKLKNGKVVSTFESLTQMYAYPKYNEIDPTPLLTPFYIVFFGMMVADAGYGLILLLGTLFVLKFVNLNKKSRLGIKFFFYLSFSVIIWGVLYGSYFGLEIPGIWRLVNPTTEFQKLLIGSVTFGLIHLFFGLAIKAYLCFKSGKPLDALYDAGFWYMALSGGIVFLLSSVLKLSETASNISMWIMIIGMIGIVLTGGREAKSIGGKLGGGLYSLYGISGYIGDLVSYSRLMALGLAGGFIAQAMNIIAGLLGSTWFGLIFVPVIFVLGHLFNMFLSFLGSYVHTSRLIYVEFFGKFYEGGGKPFKDFRTESKYINLDD
ncbi:V-type ATP synthase subunit I [Leptotrichia sp. OH3620_COT-345]|uniref:V-type ATP synthase subunit I n=1 Tax=Leptotrichia sp. OH3620_COT-345 TaxID=2491048 RepID=UPI000F6486BC|nr:V-type ATP synthase subunit I [Leptotrichia sp. OH3620_COT-345]RRD41079.1 V-type ATP synthase subunit I [Leptotrichia sp. OH3620_COT-345]